LAFRPDHFIHIGISRRAGRAKSGAHLPEKGAGIGRQWVNSEHRKNGVRFPVSRSSHQRFVGRAAFSRRMSWRDGGSRQQRRRERNEECKQKGRREAALFKTAKG
jgi:hypothetical protein